MSPITRSHTRNLPSGYQSSSDQVQSDHRLSDFTSTLDEIKAMLTAVNAESEFEKSMKTVVSLLIGQMKEWRVDQFKKQHDDLYRHQKLTQTMDDMTLSVVKSEQYTRRDVVTVVGLPLPEGPEPQSELATKVSEVLSHSGEEVKPADLSACHRNARNNRTIKGKTVPPSVTVKFNNITKKDNVLRKYKNYDSENHKPRDVKCYQSLSEHYVSVRKSIFDFFNSNADSREFQPIYNPGLKVKWVTYQSPTSGFAIKLQSGEYFKGVHIWKDFVDKLCEAVPTCHMS